MGSLHRSLEHRRNRQCLLPTLGSAERIGRFGDNSLATAERCEEISQGYALFAYPWKRGQLWNPHPERVSRIPRTLPGFDPWSRLNIRCTQKTRPWLISSHRSAVRRLPV